MKEYIITIKIDDDTIGRATNNKTIKSPNGIGEIIHEALALSGLPYRGTVETFSGKTTDGFSFYFEFVEDGNLVKLLSKIKENLGLKLKMPQEEVKLALISIKEKETSRQIF